MQSESQSVPFPNPTTDRKPRCPYCKARPCETYAHLVSFNFGVTALFCCTRCDKILSVAPIPWLKEVSQPTQGPSMIHRI